MTLILLIKGITADVACVFLVLTSKLFVHMLQLESYQTRGFFHWVIKNLKKTYLYTGIAALSFILLQALSNLLLKQNETAYLISQIALSLLLAAVFFHVMSKFKIENAKKPLVYTQRVKRLYIALCFVSLIFCAGLYALDIFVLNDTPVFGMLLYLALIMQPVSVVAAHFTMLPVENSVKKWYFNDAKKKLAAKDKLIKIGITGSYGKTSTKFILGAILSGKYNTLVTPSSFNTPMGLTRVIREQLQECHEVFIAEMGARHVDDIAELCKLVHPKYGIITSIGEQHLETFKTIENVKYTKFELIKALPKDGTAFFNADNEHCLELYGETDINKKLFGLDYEGDLYARAQEIETGSFGSRFTLAFADGSNVRVTTKLLGRHNISNIAGCAAIAHALGLTAEEIAQGIRKLNPVEHRLNILPTQNSITVIDDAFNSNPQGVRMAMEVLASFEGRKIVITPGMVELGEMEEAENYKFGKLMADTADIVFLIGEKHSRPIYEGLKDSGFDMTLVYVYNTLEEATTMLGKITKAGDVVIFENDLPDNYNE